MIFLCSCTTNSQSSTCSSKSDNIENKITDLNLSSKSYNDVLSMYKEYVHYWRSYQNNDDKTAFLSDYENGKITQPDNADSFDWSSMLIEAFEPKDLDYGYILKDINSDGIQELFWVRSDHSILAVFTICDNKPTVLDAYWPKHKCVILDTGELYICDTDGQNTFYSIKTLNKMSCELNTLKSFCRISNVDFTNGTAHLNETFFEEINGKKLEISLYEFEFQLENLPFSNGSDWLKSTITIV